MKKLAIFVEGETELEFMMQLLIEVAGQHRIEIKAYKFQGGGKVSGSLRSAIPIAQHNTANATFEVLIYNSGNDSRVNSDLLDQKNSLERSGFSAVLGLKDLRGMIGNRAITFADLPMISRADQVVERSCAPLHAKIITAVMEIEAWFLAETNHYLCIDPKLTKKKIESEASSIETNPFTDDMTQLLQPAETLGKIYKIVGKGFDKSEKHRTRTIQCLDYARLYVSLRGKIPQLNQLLVEVDAFLT
jgi:hypothetical protein